MFFPIKWPEKSENVVFLKKCCFYQHFFAKKGSLKMLVKPKLDCITVRIARKNMLSEKHFVNSEEVVSAENSLSVELNVFCAQQ